MSTPVAVIPSRLVASGAALIAVSYGLARFGLGAFVPELRATFELSGTAIGLVIGTSFAGHVVTLAVAGPLLQAWGSRRVVLASGLTATGGLLGVAAATHAVLSAGAALLGGLSTGWSSTGLATAVEDQLMGPKRAGAQTIINAGTSLGLMFAAPVAVAVAVASFRAGYMALTGLVIVWPVHDRPQQPGSAVATGFLLLAVGQTAASPIVGLAVDAFGLAAVSLASVVLALAGLTVALSHRKGTRPSRPDAPSEPRGVPRGQVAVSPRPLASRSATSRSACALTAQTNSS